ncbi:MAG: hypothetical protein ABIP20_20935 [Chthoniobacteraceae bacterium]
MVLATVALAIPLLPSAQANLVTNGGFENTVVYDSGDGMGGVNSSGIVTDTKFGDLDGWQTGPSTNSPNVVASNSQQYFGVGAGYGVYSGALSAAFPNTNNPGYNGYLSQLLGTTQDQWYTIGFYLSNQLGDPNAPLNSISVNWGATIDNAGDLVGGTYLTGQGTGPNHGSNPPLSAPPSAIPVPTGWTYYEFNVQALTNGTRLSFIGGSDPGANLIDEVSVIAVPEVSSFGMITGLGLLAFGTAARFRRRSLVTA